LLPALMEGLARYTEEAARAENVEDLFARLESCGQLIRLDQTVEPTMYRCATVTTGELDRLRNVENVVRLGRVLHVGSDRVILEDGSIPTNHGQVHVDCSAAGLHVAPARPIFEPGRITLQQVRTCQPCFNAALVAFVEASRDDDAEKNRLCPPNPYPDAAIDWIPGTRIAQEAQRMWLGEGDLAAWMERSRLNAARGVGEHIADPGMQAALTRWTANLEPALANLERLEALSLATSTST
jgi:hypothetical protein